MRLWPWTRRKPKVVQAEGKWVVVPTEPGLYQIRVAEHLKVTFFISERKR